MGSLPCIRILLMDAGAVVSCGTAEEVFQSHATDKVFGIRFCRMETETGCRYYCTD